MPYRSALLLAFAGLAGSAASAFLACSSDPAADGAECESNGDCNSGICQAGACAGRVCACSGPTCAKECDDGWTCSARGPVPGLSCVKACATATDACPSGTHCSDGLCVGGKDIKLAWVSKPGAKKCQAGTTCRYEVRADGDGAGDVKSWSWSINDAGVNDNPGAALDQRYLSPGLYTVGVTAELGDGRKGPTLEAQESVCTVDPDFECTPGGDDCCVGTCTVARRCR